MPFFDLPAAQLPNYQSSVKVPDDFDAFWAETLARGAGAQKLDARVFTPA